MSDYRKAFWHYIKQMCKTSWRRGKWRLFLIASFIIILILSYWVLEPQYSAEHSIEIANNRCYQCHINRVIDGDTVVAHCPMDNQETIRIRIWGIDAPEMQQGIWGEAAKNSLILLLSQANHDSIEIKIRDIDHYGRYVGQLFLENVDLGLELVKNGEAVVYEQYNRERDYLQAQQEAKKQKLGIWSIDGAQQDPATWRKLNPR